MTIRVEEYLRRDGSSPYRKWFESLDAQAAAKVAVAKLRLSQGNTSNVRWFAGIGECVIDWGPGYRIYLAREGETMPLTRDFKGTVVARVHRDPDFAKALLHEAATLFLCGEPEMARLVLRDLVNATIGFERLAQLTDRPSKSLQRMLSQNGNPRMDNLAAIFSAVQKKLKVGIKARTVAA